MKGKWTRLAITLAVVALLGAGIWYLLSPGNPGEAAQRTVTVRLGDLVEAASLTGRIEPEVMVEIKSRTSGEVVEVAVDVGARVKAGELLVRLDPADENRAVSQAEAALAAAEARLAKAQASLGIARLQAAEARSKFEARRSGLDGNVISKEDLRIAQSNWEIAEGTVESLLADTQGAEADRQAAKLNLEQARIRLAETTILAPIGGTVLSVQIEKGTIIASGITNIAGGTALMTLGDLSSLYVVGSLDEADVGRVDEGQDALARVDAYPGRVFTGRVKTLAPLGVETSSIVTFDLDVQITDPEFYLLRPGMSVDLEVITSRSRNVLLVPVAAIFSEGEEYHVRGPDGTRYPVRLGPTDGTDYVVLEGVHEGQQLVTAGAASNVVPGPGLFRGPR